MKPLSSPKRLPAFLAFILALAFLAGCASDPFTRPALPELVKPDAGLMRDEIEHSQAKAFMSDDTVVIEAPFRDDMAVLGVLRVDRGSDAFELMALSHMGLKLFHVAGDAKGQSIRFAIPPLLEKKDVLDAIALDTRRMYFDLVPGRAATVEVRPAFVRYSLPTPEGMLVYEIGGKPSVLLEKRLEGFWGTRWRIRYFDYSDDAAGRHPRGVILDNSQFHYRIIVKNRQWQAK